MQWLTNIIRWFQVGLLAHVETFLIITYHCNLDPHFGIDHMSYPHPFRLAMCELTSTNTHTVAVIAIMFALVSFVHIKTWLSTYTLCKTNSEETPEKVACFAQSFHNPFFFRNVLNWLSDCDIHALPKLSRSQLNTDQIVQHLFCLWITKSPGQSFYLYI